MKDKKQYQVCPECFGELVITPERIFECCGCKAIYEADSNLAPYEIYVPVVLVNTM